MNAHRISPVVRRGEFALRPPLDAQRRIGSQPPLNPAYEYATEPGRPPNEIATQLAFDGSTVTVAPQGMRRMADSVAELKAELERLKSERDALQRALDEAQVYRLAVQHAPIGIMCMSLKTGRYEFSNPAHAELLGSTPEEIVASDPHRRWMEITHPEDLKRELSDHERLARGEIRRVRSERRCIRQDGEVRWTRVDVEQVRDEDSRPTHLLVYMADRHEEHQAAEAREQLESQLRQSRKLESLGRLAGGVAHDFNNRLLIIMCYAEALRAGLPSDSPFVHHASRVLESAQRSAELTKRLLAFSRRQVLKPQAFDLNETVRGMRDLLSRVIGEDIELATVLGAKELVFADAGQIEQVILNLVLNARDAMPEGGRLLAETRDVHVAGASKEQVAAGDYIALVVEDTGAGIPKTVLPHIFEPFFTTKELGAGTGLGLSTVDGIVRQSEGSVLVESQVGKGTRFTVLLPRAKVAAQPAEDARKSRALPEPIRFETVLVCDDDDDVRQLLVDLLRIRAYHVLEARDGLQALEVAAAHEGHIDLLITDLVMPEFGGAELSRRLRTLHPKLRVLYVSGYTDDRRLLAGDLEEGARFLSKPFMPGDLVCAVSALLVDGDGG
jgi:PAS domain S-box-containing protein